MEQLLVSLHIAGVSRAATQALSSWRSADLVKTLEMGAKGACGVIDRTDCVPCTHAAISRFARRVDNRQAAWELVF